MEEIHASPKMAEIDLINNLEKISSKIPNRILKLEGYILKNNQKEKLEIIIFKGFSSSTTHPIEIDLEKKVIEFSYIIKKFKLYKSPLTETKDNFIRENQNSVFFLNQENWI
ncbi:hypothetical protein CU313_01200 [Prochlorococcus marinus str. MU1404]|uniref:DUF7734 family protein n=1 Tax=Prochlorococcus marinus TaxID=1219 RepID=UPI001ADB9F95|nr:hypothetical protein [Prochlorococcus marinus]MBO8229410.1 hypothetical protein [Prochlorococcus marinus XMU1404]MBW3072493.1 hypothetical protein [Prochlorococcus marinus str. MU1404]MCR8544406.1 hypothetical protein [Prochlorococcus marinus CUG1432]